VKKLRAEAAQKGLDPNVWLGNVEMLTAARIGTETVNYVSYIYKYYAAYKLIATYRRKSRAKQRNFFRKSHREVRFVLGCRAAVHQNRVNSR